MKKDFKNIKRNKGGAMLIFIVFFLFISLAIVAGLVSPSVREFKNANMNLNSKKAYFLAESGVEDATYRLLKNKNITGNETLTLDSNSVNTTITTTSGNNRQIDSLGDVLNFQRKVSLSLNVSDGVSFNYGVQVGQGGLILNGSAGISGNVYANGPIRGSTSSFISGTAISANSPAENADQSSGEGIPAYDITFGKVSGSQDVAQSFQLATESPLNKVQFYIKKVGTPGDVTVKIVNNSNGSPGTTVLASGILSASGITTSYGWANLSFTTSPLLSVDTTYWLVIDASVSSSKYYIIGASSGAYVNGIGKIGQQGGVWNNTSPVGLDYFFKIYLGGLDGLITGTSNDKWNQLSVGTSGSGSAQAHAVNYTEATGLIYCQTGTGNNKACTPQADPTYIDYPISDANIEQWKEDAALGGTITGNYNVSGSNTAYLGPKKITGNLIIEGSGILYMTGTLWVQGNVMVSGSGKIVLASSYDHNSGILVSDGYLNLGGSGKINGTGQSGSYILFTTTSNCDASFCAQNAIDISGSAGSVILNAQNGTIKFSGSASAKEATAYKMYLDGSAVVSYESGLANVNFSSGPSGSWSINNWGETE